MVFSSFLFLFAFLPACLLSYFLAPSRLKNVVLLVWSLLFYAWGAPRFFSIFLVSCAADFALGLMTAAASRPVQRRALLALSLVVNLSALFYFKYANFFVGEFNRMLAALGAGSMPWASVALPVGISFITFHKISYIVDVYRGVVQPARNFLNYALYIALFPQLIAGPIVRYHDISDQIASRRHSLEDAWQGAVRFCIGLAKKVLIADAMGQVAVNVSRLHPDQLSTGYAWLGIVCYAYQIYFDFSGYSDMAIGLAKIFGFTFLENFNQPYLARNFTDFWRRWHISLSRWMRDYLYIPLGGNRVSPLRTYFNLWIVFLLSGLWHGANWTFIVWGAFHGFFLAFDKLLWLDLSKRFGAVFNTVLTFVLVLIGWVFFRSQTLSEAITYLTRMFNPIDYAVQPGFVWRSAVIHNQGMFVFVVATCICFLPAFPQFKTLRALVKRGTDIVPDAVLRLSACSACLFSCAFTLAATNYTPFIYFRF